MNLGIKGFFSVSDKTEASRYQCAKTLRGKHCCCSFHIGDGDYDLDHYYFQVDVLLFSRTIRHQLFVLFSGRGM